MNNALDLAKFGHRNRVKTRLCYALEVQEVPTFFIVLSFYRSSTLNKQCGVAQSAIYLYITTKYKLEAIQKEGTHAC